MTNFLFRVKMEAYLKLTQISRKLLMILENLIRVCWRRIETYFSQKTAIRGLLLLFRQRKERSNIKVIKWTLNY